MVVGAEENAAAIVRDGSWAQLTDGGSLGPPSLAGGGFTAEIARSCGAGFCLGGTPHDAELVTAHLSRRNPGETTGGHDSRMDHLSDSWTAQPGGRVGAVEYVLRDLREAIIAGVVQVGDRLPSEQALAARYGVSRAVIREVLRVLETRGMTVTRTGRGTFVAAREPARELKFGDYSAADLMEARPHIEVAAAGLAAVRRSEDQIGKLQELQERMEVEQDAAKWVEFDSALHAAIAAASGNPVFADVLDHIRFALAHQSSVINLTPGRRTQSDSEHRAIIAAIARGSVVEAEDSMSFHLDQVREVLLDLTVLDERR